MKECFYYKKGVEMLKIGVVAARRDIAKMCLKELVKDIPLGKLEEAINKRNRYEYRFNDGRVYTIISDSPTSQGLRLDMLYMHPTTSDEFRNGIARSICMDGKIIEFEL